MPASSEPEEFLKKCSGAVQERFSVDGLGFTVHVHVPFRVHGSGVQSSVFGTVNHEPRTRTQNLEP
jgi:hypothetical protein